KKFRIDENAATAVLSSLIPESVRQIVADIFARSCRHAHIQAPACWDLTLSPTFLRLNVGQVALLSLKRGELFLCVASPVPRVAHGIRVRGTQRPVYAAVPIESRSLWLAVEDASLLTKPIVSAHQRYIEEAASRKRGSPWQAAHSPAA